MNKLKKGDKQRMKNNKVSENLDAVYTRGILKDKKSRNYINISNRNDYYFANSSRNLYSPN